MKAEEILQTAAGLVGGPRAESHGDISISMQTVADFWSVYLGMKVTAEQVAGCMVLLKLSRAKCGKRNSDDYIDMAGYSAIAGQISSHD